MQVNDAVRLINSTTFRPGWRLSARPARYDPTSIVITYDIDTVDTSYPDEAGRYKVGKHLTSDIVHDVSSKDAYQLLRAVLDDAHQIDQHEDREFLRVRQGGAWIAPFHPHNPDGEARWEETERALWRSVRIVHGDNGEIRDAVPVAAGRA
jgi:hypothetical protein